MYKKGCEKCLYHFFTAFFYLLKINAPKHPHEDPGHGII